jgi:hypothetical protein
VVALSKTASVQICQGMATISPTFSPLGSILKTPYATSKLGFYRVGPQPLNHASVDSYTVKPAKQFLHSIRKNNYSSDSPEESAGIICICVKKFFNHTKAC